MTNEDFDHKLADAVFSTDAFKTLEMCISRSRYLLQNLRQFERRVGFPERRDNGIQIVEFSKGKQNEVFNS